MPKTAVVLQFVPKASDHKDIPEETLGVAPGIITPLNHGRKDSKKIIPRLTGANQGMMAGLK